MDDVDDGKASDPITELSSQSGWHLGVDSDSVYFDHRGSSILSDDFGWNSNFHHHHQQQQQTEIGSNLTEKIDVTSFINNRFDESGLRSSFLADASESEAAALPTAPVASKQSVSSSSCEDPVEKSSSSDVKPSSSSVSTSTSKKTGQKRIRQQRFAFMTKSEIDHLEDGYRWRKYGQKAVKNSPYPRSYYRCTNTKCTVKKRVERSSQDPTVVITTYEGQHCHHAVGLSRSGGIISINTTSQEGATFGGRQLGLIPSITSLPLYYPGGMQSMQVSAPVAVARSRPACTEFPPEVTQQQQQQPQQQQPNDDGLLGHILPPGMRNQLL